MTDRQIGNQGKDGGTSPPGQDSSPNFANLAGMGVQFVVAILVFLFLGKWLDGRLGTSPWFLILGVFGAAGASTYAMYRKVFPSERPKPPSSRVPPA
jgi:ATP synthase protein I